MILADTLLLNRHEDQIQITDDEIVAAAGNSRNGKEVMTLLLDLLVKGRRPSSLFP